VAKRDMGKGKQKTVFRKGFPRKKGELGTKIAGVRNSTRGGEVGYVGWGPRGEKIPVLPIVEKKGKKNINRPKGMYSKGTGYGRGGKGDRGKPTPKRWTLASKLRS